MIQKSKSMKKTMKKSGSSKLSKSYSTIMVDSIKNALKFLAPSTFGNYDKCMENKCKNEYNSYFKAVPKLQKKIMTCHKNNMGNKKEFIKCNKKAVKELKELKDMESCSKKHCKPEKQALKKESLATVKKLKASMKKYIKRVKKSSKKSMKSMKSSKKSMKSSKKSMKSMKSSNKSMKSMKSASKK